MLQLIHHNGQPIAELTSTGILLRTAQDALELMMDPEVPAPKKLILHKQNISADFFDLHTGLAGDVLQKFVNYHAQLAIVGDFSDIQSEAFKALMRESNRGTHVFFVGSVEEAKEKLTEIS